MTPESHADASQPELVMVTGVTGYVGGRLAPRLLEAGYRVRVLVRGGPQRLAFNFFHGDQRHEVDLRRRNPHPIG